MDDTFDSSTYFAGWTSTEAEPDVNTSSFAVSELPSLIPQTSGELSRELINKELKWLFVLHTYGFACLFFVLAFYTFFSILNLRSLTSSSSCMTTINVFVCLLGVVRSSCLFIDPYHLRETLPRTLGTVLWDLGYPSVMAAFCFVQLAFLKLTQVHVGPASMRKKTCLSVIITGHVCCVLGSDVITAFQNHLVVVKYAVQTLFLGWGIFLCCTFLYAGYKVMSLLKLMPESAMLGAQPGSTNKGIMQLAMIAPYTNLASCLTAALMPTLLGPSPHRDARDARDASEGESDASPGIRQLGTSTPPAAVLEPSVLAAGQKWSPGRRRKARSASASALPPSACRRSSSTSSNTSSARSRRTSELGVKFSMDLPSSSDGTAIAPPKDGVVSPRSPRLQRSIPQLGSAKLNEPVASNTLHTRDLLKGRSSDNGKETSHPDLGEAKKTLKNAASSDEEAMIDLPQRQPRSTDLTLDSILNHIAFVNRTSGQRQVSMDSGECKSQVRRVLRVTYATALLGLLLCLAELCQLFIPLAVLTYNSVWPWFCLHSMARTVEFAMGCAMANITKQPANTRYNQRPFGHLGARREPHYL